MLDKQYKGTCYIGVVGGEIEYGPCRDSIANINKQPGDEGPFFIRATKGYEARQQHLNKWYDQSEHAFMLLLDHDTIFEPDCLDRLRHHQIPYLSGNYMRRRYNPVLPVWYDNGKPGVMPMRPMTRVPPDNALIPLGASGWGCILMHRDVVTATRPILKGEPEIIEDDMDVYPYDLQAILDGREKLIPLRSVKDAVGSDIRFPFFAKLAGFQLYGDTGCKCYHVTSYPLSPDDYASQSGAAIRDISHAIDLERVQEIERLRKAKPQ